MRQSRQMEPAPPWGDALMIYRASVHACDHAKRIEP
jgi:hypothetical protein